MNSLPVAPTPAPKKGYDFYFSDESGRYVVTHNGVDTRLEMQEASDAKAACDRMNLGQQYRWLVIIRQPGTISLN